MLLKCCAQYASKFRKLISGHRTGKGQFSFHSQRRTLPKNVQTTIQLHSFHMVARLCSKSFKLGLHSTRTENFQMYKLDLEKSEEPEIKLPKSTGSQKTQENFRRTLTSVSLISQSLTVWITANCGKFLKRWEYQITLSSIQKGCFSGLLRNLYPGQEATVRTGHGPIDLFQIEKGESQSCIQPLYII